MKNYGHFRTQVEDQMRFMEAAAVDSFSLVKIYKINRYDIPT